MFVYIYNIYSYKFSNYKILDKYIVYVCMYVENFVIFIKMIKYNGDLCYV